MGVHGSWFMVQDSGFRVQSSGFRVQGSGFRVPVQGLGFRGETDQLLLLVDVSLPLFRLLRLMNGD